MKYFISLILILVFSLFLAPQVLAQQSPAPQRQEFYKAKVIQVEKQDTKLVEGVRNIYQKIKVQILEGPDNGKTVEIESGLNTTLSPSQVVTSNEMIVLTKIAPTGQKAQYQVYDIYRINEIIYIGLAFVLIVIFIAGWKGLGSIVGLIISLSIIFLYVVPQILNGADPLLVSIYGSLAILFLTTYLAHGVSKQTTVALFSTFIVLMLTAWLSSFFVNMTHLSGFTEETSSLQFGPTSNISVKGLLLGGIIIGTLGALNDITTTQAAAVFELAATDIKLTFKQLFKKSFSIGREHVVSMVNTLVLAYAGSALALFLFIILNPLKLPIWVMINSED
ncbi:MAG TPA: YibE/F family protein, partial [Candidatus Saccharimonadales bacterium]|nr:YibE/F family protein [Candidatus Saccharimonadales bacterium]